jgi:hypothetical protein
MPLTLPAPEQLGIACNTAPARPEADWADVHRRLERLGAISFHQQKLTAGGYRFTCQLPSGQASRARQIEAEAATAAEAAVLALDRAEQQGAEGTNRR